MNAFWIGKVNSRRGPAELSYIRPQELIQEVLEMNQFLDSGFAQPLANLGNARIFTAFVTATPPL